MSIDNSKQTLESMSQAVWYNKWTVKKFESFLKGDILEIGCGIGNFTNFLKKYGNVWAMDIVDSYIKQTSQIAGGGINVGFGDIEKGKYFFSKQKFDTIVCLNVLEHIKDDKKALENMYGLLNKNGQLVLLVPVFDFLMGEIDRSIGHFRRYKKGVLTKNLEGIGFKIIKNRILNFLGAIGWWIFSRLFSTNKINESNIKIFNLIAPLILPVEDLFEPPLGTSILIIAQK